MIFKDEKRIVTVQNPALESHDLLSVITAQESCGVNIEAKYFILSNLRTKTLLQLNEISSCTTPNNN